MAQKSGFFNSLLSEGKYDRAINANDFRQLIAAIVSTGVRRSYLNDLRVTAAGGMALSVGAGFAVIEGAYYVNDAAFDGFAVPSAPTGDYSRIDRIAVRLDDSVAVRAAELVYMQGIPAASPAPPALNRGGGIYEIALADILVKPMATEIAQSDITDQRANAELCGWISPPIGYEDLISKIDSEIDEWFAEKRDTIASVTLTKRYSWSTTLTAAASAVTFNIPQYVAGSTSQLWVFVNGNIEVEGNDYTLNGSTITFAASKIAGTQIDVFCLKSIDGTGLGSVSDEITRLQNEMVAVQGIAAYTYNCTGAADNISLSQIAQAFLNGGYVAEDCTPAAVAFLEELGGNAALAEFGSRSQLTVRVVGRCGVTSPNSGTGLNTSRFKWFEFGQSDPSDKRIIFDFAACDDIKIQMSGNTSNIIFYGTDVCVKNASVSAVCSYSGCVCSMVEGIANNGRIHFEHCKLKIQTTARANIAINGDFINCDTHVTSANNHALSFVPESNCVIRIEGGRHYAYCGKTENSAAVIYIYATQTNAVVYGQGMICPEIARNGFYQTSLAVCYAGKTVLYSPITTLATVGTYVTNVNPIAINKE